MANEYPCGIAEDWAEIGLLEVGPLPYGMTCRSVQNILLLTDCNKETLRKVSIFNKTNQF